MNKTFYNKMADSDLNLALIRKKLQQLKQVIPVSKIVRTDTPEAQSALNTILCNPLAVKAGISALGSVVAVVFIYLLAPSVLNRSRPPLPPQQDIRRLPLFQLCVRRVLLLFIAIWAAVFTVLLF